ncbi:MAG TPA: tetratricopeptide repeat protein [Candidatus Limnocylindrales bacterium]|nr:tetratricopeptide repeat protein [Candidatus Limnocylindrales bacterium]
MDEPSRPLDDRESAYELFQRGLALIRGRHHAQAAVVLERASRAEPNKGSILEALGRACFNSAQYDRARETFERLLEVDPSSPYAHFGLGQSLKRLGRRAEARTHLRLAVALDPRSSLYRGALARLGPAPRPKAEAEADPAVEGAPEPGSVPGAASSPESGPKPSSGSRPDPRPEPPGG